MKTVWLLLIPLFSSFGPLGPYPTMEDCFSALKELQRQESVYREGFSPQERESASRVIGFCAPVPKEDPFNP